MPIQPRCRRSNFLPAILLTASLLHASALAYAGPLAQMTALAHIQYLLLNSKPNFV